jgi:hypothetical protein
MHKLLIAFFFLSACSTVPTSPDWTRQPTRTVDGGYIVYIGTGEASNAERAQFKAEGLALEDLANECSMIPKGVRIEDRFVEKSEHESKAYVKLALEFQECEQARRTNDPSEIKKIANVAFTEQLKRYQDLEETGEMPDRSEVAEVEPPSEISQPPPRAVGWSEPTHFYVMRQYVAYQKEIVVLSPPTAYAANSPANKQFIAQVQPAAEQLHGIEEKTPALRKQAWSKVPDRPAVSRPQNLAPRHQMAHSIRPPARQNRGGERPHGHGRKKSGGRRAHFR